MSVFTTLTRNNGAKITLSALNIVMIEPDSLPHRQGTKLTMNINDSSGHPLEIHVQEPYDFVDKSVKECWNFQ
ncbi:MAG: hypothetical protein EOM90_04690 [Alphaproteobacteria bacterium]|nr:hypothetical protein [Alphaproteobacteria bacterium]